MSDSEEYFESQFEFMFIEGEMIKVEDLREKDAKDIYIWIKNLKDDINYLRSEATFYNGKANEYKNLLELELKRPININVR